MNEMKIYTLTATHKRTGKTVKTDITSFLKQIKKNPLLMNSYTDFKVTENVAKSYTFDAWIHPKKGGDDYCERVSICADDEATARKYLETYISKKSEVTTDYSLVKEVI